LFDICAGFTYSQILFACVKVKLFEALARGPKTVGELGRDLPLPIAGIERLLCAAASLRLAEKRHGGRYGLGVLGAAMLGNPGVAAMVEHHAMLYADLADPIALLRGDKLNTALGDYWSYARSRSPGALGADQIGAYSALMSASQSLIAGEVLDAYRFDRHRCLLDVGGGEGAFVCAAAERLPRLRVMLFDLPAVAERAAARLAAAGLGDHAVAFGGSFHTDALPRGADLISLIRVLHDHDDHVVARILAAVRAALPKRGTVLIAEPMAETPGAEPAGNGYFGFYLMAMGSGRARSPAELSAMLRQAGFHRVRVHRTHTPLLTRVLTAVVES
jgi:demethylspheroidene O-methyltransferase